MPYPIADSTKKDVPYDEAEEFAMQQLSDWHAGGEVLELSNPGDYPYDPDDEPEYEIVRA